MNEVCDFANSYLRWVDETNHRNTVRISLDARCCWTDGDAGQTEDFVLICRCQGEVMYVGRGLLGKPPYNFGGVFSATQSYNIRTSADAAVQRDTVEDHVGRFGSVATEVATFEDAVELTTAAEIIEATLSTAPLIARTEIQSSDGRIHVTMEYPVTTMNVSSHRQLWQVDTGPVLFPDLGRETDRRIEKLVPAFVVYNTTAYAEVALYSEVQLTGGGTTRHFADLRAVSAQSRLYAGRPL